jgi:hypothetical protein
MRKIFMKNKILIFFVAGIFLLTLFYSSCKKEDSCVAGTGGGLTVVAKLYHRGKLIANDSLHPDTVFVKYNAQGSPGFYPSDYDTFAIGKKGEDFINIAGLKCGDYYFFGVGLDTVTYPGDSIRVSGGTPFATENNSGEINFSIPVF